MSQQKTPYSSPIIVPRIDCQKPSHHFIYRDTPFMISKHIVLVGIMGAGKTSIGRLLAKRLGMPFVDSDDEIELASGYRIADFFDIYGEKAFREGEAKVIQRLLVLPRLHVISTGGGSFLDPRTRQKIRERGLSIWIRAGFDTLVRRVARRNNRPLLNRGNQREILSKIMQDRYNTYQEADFAIDSEAEHPKTTVNHVINALCTYLTTKKEQNP